MYSGCESEIFLAVVNTTIQIKSWIWQMRVGMFWFIFSFDSFRWSMTCGLYVSFRRTNLKYFMRWRQNMLFDVNSSISTFPHFSSGPTRFEIPSVKWLFSALIHVLQRVSENWIFFPQNSVEKGFSNSCLLIKNFSPSRFCRLDGKSQHHLHSLNNNSRLRI